MSKQGVNMWFTTTADLVSIFVVLGSGDHQRTLCFAGVFVSLLIPQPVLRNDTLLLVLLRDRTGEFWKRRSVVIGLPEREPNSTGILRARSGMVGTS